MSQHRIEGLVLNPRLADQTREVLTRAWSDRRIEIEGLAPGAIGILTSGTTQSTAKSDVMSIVILSESAVSTSAKAVNDHFAMSRRHVWGVMLPRFHVGGLMISKRAALSGSGLVEFGEAWSPQAAAAFLELNKVTHVSFVPTQIFDLVEARLRAPQSLEAVIVGGGRLDQTLKRRGRELGWPLLESYGLTEFGSQIATELPTSTATNDNTDGWMKVLSHVQVRTDSKTDRLLIRGESALSGILVVSLLNGNSQLFAREQLGSHQSDGYWQTQDRVLLRQDPLGTTLKFIGRATEVVKILGENVDLARTRQEMARVLSDSHAITGASRQFESWEIVAVPDLRRENEIVLVLQSSILSPAECETLLNATVAGFRSALLPVEIPTRAIAVERIPISPMGKVLNSELLDLISSSSKK